MKRHTLAGTLAILFLAATAAPSVALADPPTASPEPRAIPRAEPAPGPIYRFEFAIRRPEDAPNARLPTYSLAVEEHHSGAISLGTNVALTVPGSGGAPAPRQDVGMMFHFTFQMRGNIVVLTGSVEMSDVETGSASGVPPAIHRVRADGMVPLTPDHPAVFATLTDVTSRRTYEITVTARRVL